MNKPDKITSMKFWGIIFGTHSKDGDRCVPTPASRKRLEKLYGFKKPLSWWREEWINGKDVA